MEKDKRVRKKQGVDTQPKDEQFEITSVEQFFPLGGAVIAYTNNDGAIWRYAKLDQNVKGENFPHTYWQDAHLRRGNWGIPVNDEIVVIKGKPVHVRSSITTDDFLRPGFAVRTTTSKEVAGKRFSYENLR